MDKLNKMADMLGVQIDKLNKLSEPVEDYSYEEWVRSELPPHFEKDIPKLCYHIYTHHYYLNGLAEPNTGWMRDIQDDFHKLIRQIELLE